MTNLSILNELSVVAVEVKTRFFSSCKSLLYPDGKPFNIAIEAVRFPKIPPDFDLNISRGSGFFFCGMALEVELAESASSIYLNSSVVQRIRSSEILLKVIITMLRQERYSRITSRELVASMLLILN